MPVRADGVVSFVLILHRPNTRAMSFNWQHSKLQSYGAISVRKTTKKNYEGRAEPFRFYSYLVVIFLFGYRENGGQRFLIDQERGKNRVGDKY